MSHVTEMFHCRTGIFKIIIIYFFFSYEFMIRRQICVNDSWILHMSTRWRMRKRWVDEVSEAIWAWGHNIKHAKMCMMIEWGGAKCIKQTDDFFHESAASCYVLTLMVGDVSCDVTSWLRWEGEKGLWKLSEWWEEIFLPLSCHFTQSEMVE